MLVEVARRLQTAVRPGDTIARLGGDEFVAVCEDLDEEAAAAYRAKAAGRGCIALSVCQ